MKHTGLTKHQGTAVQKVTGKTRIDWAFLSKQFPLFKEQIKRHKNDQKYLAKLKEKLQAKGA